MDPETNAPQTTETTDTTQSAPTTEERKFSQSEVDRIVADRLARERRQQPQRQQPSEQRQSAPATKAEPDAAILIAEFQDNLDAISEEIGVKVPVEFKRKIRSLYVNERPAEPNAWLKDWLSGLSQQRPSTTTQPTNQQPAPQPTAPQPQQTRPAPISDKGPAANPARDVDAVLLDDINSLSATDIERLKAKHGDDKALAMIADAGMRYLRTVKPRADRRR